MLAAQYIIRLASGHDMAIIRHRVATRFLFGDGFDALQTSFGRPRIDTALVVAAAAHFEESGPLGGSATVEREMVPPGADLPTLRETEQAWVIAATSAGARAAASAVDASEWQLVRFTLWPARRPESGLQAPGERYELLHLSMDTDMSAGATGA